MPLIVKKTALDKGDKHTAKGLSLFDKAIARLKAANQHLEAHAAEASDLAVAMQQQAEEAQAKAEKNQGAISRLETLLHGEPQS